MTGASPRKSRLSRSADFDRVYRHGRSSQHRLMVLYRFDRPEDVDVADDRHPSRLGATVSKKIGNAVVRNKLKRQLLEAMKIAEFADKGVDFVVIARAGLPEAVERQGFDWLLEQLIELHGKLIPTEKP